VTAVRLEGLTKLYGDVAAVDDVTLEVREGEFLVLLGPSGCGKTTTLRLVAGFVEATRGAIRLGGRDVTRVPPHRRNIGLVFQNYALFPHLSVFENVAFGLRRRRVAGPEIAARVRRALGLVRLEGFESRLPRELSGGQQQRVAIARAVAIEPDVLLLDEPLSNLDAKLRHEVRSELRRLQKTLTITTIMVTHDQDEAMAVADRLAVMGRGRIQQVGAPAEVYRSPANRFVASFIGRGNFLEASPAPGGGGFALASGLVLASGGRAEAGARTVMIRPEAVEVAAEPLPGPNGFAATVEAAAFLGASWELELKLDGGGERLMAAVPAGADAEDWPTGRRVFVRVQPGSVVGIRDPGPPSPSAASTEEKPP
jgi:putative spermidine/putrescine transport system ATP-binding protein